MSLHNPASVHPTSSEKLLYVSPPPQAEADDGLNALLTQVNTSHIPAGY